MRERIFFELTDIEDAAHHRGEKKTALIAPPTREAVFRLREPFTIEREVTDIPRTEGW